MPQEVWLIFGHYKLLHKSNVRWWHQDVMIVWARRLHHFTRFTRNLGIVTTIFWLGYSSRRPNRVLLLSAKNRKRRIQFAQAHQNRTIEDCKNVAWSDESRFLLRHSDGRVRIWRKKHKSMDPSYLVSTVQAGGGGVMERGIFSWHTLGPLAPIEHRLNATAYLSIVTDHVLYDYSVPIFWWLLPAG